LHEILALKIESLKIIVKFYISIPKNGMYLVWDNSSKQNFLLLHTKFVFWFQLIKGAKSLNRLKRNFIRLLLYFKEQTTFKKVSEVISKD
jgi:hypothetical protein